MLTVGTTVSTEGVAVWHKNGGGWKKKWKAAWLWGHLFGFLGLGQQNLMNIYNYTLESPP